MPIKQDLARDTETTPEDQEAEPGFVSDATLLIKAIDRSDWTPEASAAAGPVDRNSPVPLYVQIRRRLLALIASWPDPRRRFFTDDELCQMFGVARMTVRTALKEFVDKGLLVRARGAGTYVSVRKVEEHFSPRMDFIDQWAIHGRPLNLDVRTFDVVPAPAAFAEALGLDADTPVLLVERLRSAGGVPVSIDYRYILRAAATAMTPDTARQQSLLDLLAGTVELDYADMTIEATRAKGSICDLLELLPGDPVLVRGLIYYASDEQPIMAGVSYYRHDQSGYSIRVPLKAGTTHPDDAVERSNETGNTAWGRLIHVKQVFGRARCPDDGGEPAAEPSAEFGDKSGSAGEPDV